LKQLASISISNWEYDVRQLHMKRQKLISQEKPPVKLPPPYPIDTPF
jgi:hypothetical protein